MADANTVVSLDALHDAIEAAIQAQFTDLQTVEFYRDDEAPPATPACLLDMTEMESGAEPDPGTGQMPVWCRFEARFLFRYGPTTKKDIRRFAAAFIAFLRVKRWPDPATPGKTLPTGPAEFIGAYRDHWTPTPVDQLYVWCVEWRQIVHLGTHDFWFSDGTTPTQVSAGFAPDIGTGNEGKYTPIAP